jgi:2'-5' RNA ligase
VRSDRAPDTADATLRLFVALELPESVRTATDAWTASALGATESLRPVRVDGLHVTLCFLGRTAGAEVEAIGACCRRVCAGHRRLRLSFDEPLALPRRRPRAIAVGVSDIGDRQPNGLVELQRGLADGLAEGGWYRPEPRPYLAHVTVARVRSGARLSGARLDVGALRERANPSAATRLPTTFTADVVTLFASRTQPGGAVYQPRARIELAA